MTTERLRLVTDFSELRAGMLVVLKRCLACRGTHRGILTALDDRPSRDPRDGSILCDLSWIFLPNTPCGEIDKSPCFGKDAVLGRRVYRVLDGLERDDATIATEVKPREKEMAR